MIADQIQSMDVQEALQDSLTYPSVPAGYTISVESSSNEDVIGTDGHICAAVNDTTVTVTLRVTDSNGESAVTGNIDVVVKGLDSIITGISVPARGAQTLAMPDLPDGYTVTVASSDKEDIISTGDGSITTPEKDTLVTVSLQLTRESDGASVTSQEYTVLIYGSEESPELDVNALAANMYASSGSWDKTLNAEQCAQRLFDGDESTFGDLASGNTYTIDFGEGNAILPTKFRLLPRAGGRNNTEYLGRMNGAFMQGSADGNEWVNITAPLEGVNEFKYYDITAEDFLTCGSYRYIRITGASSGNISEAEIYGLTVQAEVPEEEPIDVAGLAVSMTASSGDWNNTLTAEQCAAQLFDGNEDTFGDLKTGNTYTIDFGEGTVVTPSKFAVYPRKGTGNKPAAEFVARLNGVKFQGSNDGTTWVDLTAALDGIAARDETAVKWHELAVTTTEGYRYIQITGAEGGNMAEVKFYGTVTKGSTATLTKEPEAPVAAEPEASRGNAESKPEAGNSDTVTDAGPETGNAVTDADAKPETGSSETAADETTETNNSEVLTEAAPEVNGSGTTTEETPATDGYEETASSEMPEAPGAQPTDAITPELTVTPEEGTADDNTDTSVDAE